MTEAESERFWRHRASQLAWKWNAAWWLERFNPLAIGGLIAYSVVLLGARTLLEQELPPAWVGGTLFTLLLAFAVSARFVARARFIGERDGLVRLEERLGLNNSLTCAEDGIVAWPDTAAGEGAGFRWNPTRAWLPGLVALALVTAAWFVPVPNRDGTEVLAPVEPAAWEQMEEWLADLKEEPWIEESTIEELSERIEELRDQPKKEWFSHSSLEATDTLMDTLGREMRDLANEMAALERNLSALQNDADSMSEADRQDRIREYEEALEALAGSGIGVNENLLKQLREIDPSSLGRETLGNLSAEELSNLQEQLRQGAGALGSMQGLPPMGEDPSLQMLGAGPGAGEGMPFGQGGLDEGGGAVPLFFGDKESDLRTENIERVTNEDFSRATLGEVLGLGETEREIDETTSEIREAGGILSTGKGGAAVSRETFRPEEQAVLKRYFKAEGQ